MSAKPKPIGEIPRRPRGRPKLEDLAELEARLIDAGSQVFFREGYGGATMSEVADVARVSKTTLYSRFPSKADLLRGIVETQLDSWSTGPNHQPAPRRETLEATLRAYGKQVLRAGLSYEFRELNRLMHAESGRFPEVAELAEHRYDMGAHTIAIEIDHFAERDGVPCRESEAAARFFLTLLAGWVHLYLMTNRPPKPEASEAWLEKVITVFLSDRANW